MSKPFKVPREDFKKWVKPSHQLTDVPGYYKDPEQVYDVGVVCDKVTIYPGVHWKDPARGGRK